MARRQKHYSTQESIIAAIDSAKDNHKQLLGEAEQQDGQAKQNFKDAANPKMTPGDATHLMAQGRECQRQAKKLRKSAYNIETIRLPRLKNTLAAFNTEILPGVVDNRTVIYEKK